MIPDLTSARSLRRSPILFLLGFVAGALASPPPAGAGIELSDADGYWATSAPPVQREHAAVYVPDHDLLLAIVPAGPADVEVWALPLEQADAWIRLFAGGGPALGPGITAVYDPLEREVIVHGGKGSPAESWVLELEPELAWRRISTLDQGPGARWDHAAVYDLRRGSVLLHGGRNEDGLLSDLWEIDLRETHPRWRQLQQHGLRPEAVAGHAAVHDPVGGRTLVFGGGDLEGESDVWALSLGGPGNRTALWTRIPLATGPGSSRTEHTLVRDPSNGRVYLHGGVDANGVAQRDLWRLDLGAEPAWSLLAPGGIVSPLRSEHVAVLDPLRNRMVVAGGVPPLPGRNETWVLTLDEASGASRWDRFAPAAAQAAGTWDDRGIAIAGAFDTNRGSLVVMQSRLDPPSRTWILGFDPNPRWTRVFDPPTRSADFYYDAARDRIVLHGGYLAENNPLRSNGTWELSLGEGLFNGYRPVMIAPGPMPTPRSDHLVLHDPRRDRMFVFGGLVSQGPCGIAVDSHLLNCAQPPFTWSSVTANPIPEGGPFAAGVYDEANDRFIIQGGLFGCRFPNHPSGSFWDGTWALAAASPAAWVRLASPNAAPGDLSDATYDPVDRRMVAVRAGGEAWALSLDPGTEAWRRLALHGQPPSIPIQGQVVFEYDRKRDRFVVVTLEGHVNYLYPGRGTDNPPIALGNDGVAGRSPADVAAAGAGRLGLSLTANPARGPSLALEVALPGTAPGRLELLDVRGRIVAARELSAGARGTQSLVVAGQPPGVYFVRIVQGVERSVKKVVLM